MALANQETEPTTPSPRMHKPESTELDQTCNDLQCEVRNETATILESFKDALANYTVVKMCEHNETRTVCEESQRHYAKELNEFYLKKQLDQFSYRLMDIMYDSASAFEAETMNPEQMANDTSALIVEAFETVFKDINPDNLQKRGFRLRFGVKKPSIDGSTSFGSSYDSFDTLTTSSSFNSAVSKFSQKIKKTNKSIKKAASKIKTTIKSKARFRNKPAYYDDSGSRFIETPRKPSTEISNKFHPLDLLPKPIARAYIDAQYEIWRLTNALGKFKFNLTNMFFALLFGWALYRNLGKGARVAAKNNRPKFKPKIKFKF